jgi:hypothetical protein
MTKTINIITPFYYPTINGLSNVVQKNVEVLLSLNYKINVFTSCGSKSFSNEIVYEFDLKGNGSLFNPIRGRKNLFLESIEAHSINSELIIIHGWHSSFTNLVLENFNKIHAKICLYSHGTGFETNENWLLKFIRKINYIGERKKMDCYFKNIDYMIFITKKVNHPRCYDLLNFKKNKFFINNTVNYRKIISNSSRKILSDINNLVNNKKYQRLLFCLSNFEEIKNQLYLIKLSKIYNFKLICVGSNSTRYMIKLRQYIITHNLSEQVLLLYQQDDFTIDWLYKNSDFFIFASKNDFSPLVLIEAAKYKLPFLSYETADENRPGGFFCKNKFEFEERLNYMLSLTRNELQKLGLNGFNYYQKNHTPDVYQNNLNNFITNIL